MTNGYRLQGNRPSIWRSLLTRDGLQRTLTRVLHRRGAGRKSAPLTHVEVFHPSKYKNSKWLHKDLHVSVLLSEDYTNNRSNREVSVLVHNILKRSTCHLFGLGARKFKDYSASTNISSRALWVTISCCALRTDRWELPVLLYYFYLSTGRLLKNLTKSAIWHEISVYLQSSYSLKAQSLQIYYFLQGKILLTLHWNARKFISPERGKNWYLIRKLAPRTANPTKSSKSSFGVAFLSSHFDFKSFFTSSRSGFLLACQSSFFFLMLNILKFIYMLWVCWTAPNWKFQTQYNGLRGIIFRSTHEKQWDIYLKTITLAKLETAYNKRRLHSFF